MVALIGVGVALEIAAQIEAYLIENRYEGFLHLSSRLKGGGRVELEERDFIFLLDRQGPARALFRGFVFKDFGWYSAFNRKYVSKAYS